MTGLRAFLAAELGEPARRAAAEAARELARGVRGREVRWVRPEAYHLTLRFLGEIEAERVAPLAARVARALADVAPFELRLGRVVAFPSPRRARVVAVTLEPEAPLAELARRVEAAVVAEGLPPEERPYRAHLTLGRVRDRTHPELAALPPLEAPPFRVAELVLFQSELHDSGAVHTPLERIALGGSDPHPKPTSQGGLHGEDRPAP